MPMSNLTTNPKDVVIIQRSNNNSSFGEVRISGSKLLLHIDANGYVNADKSASFYTLYPPPSVGGTSGYSISASWASQSLNSNFATSASWASQSLSASWAPAGGYSISASWASHSLTSGTSSWAVNAINGGTQLITGSTYPITASWAEYVVNGGGTSDSSSWASHSLNSDSTISASWASHSLTADTSSHAGVAELVVAYPDSVGVRAIGLLGSNTGYVNVYADSGGYLTYNTDTSTLTSPIITASLLFGTSSWAVNAVSASWAPDTSGGSSNYSISSSWASQSLSASWAPATPSSATVSASWASASLSASYVVLADTASSVFATTYYTTLVTSSNNAITCSFLNSVSQIELPVTKAYSFTTADPPAAGKVADTVLYISHSMPPVVNVTSSLSFPSSWMPVGNSFPTQIFSGKYAVLWLHAMDTGVIIGSYTVQP